MLKKAYITVFDDLEKSHVWFYHHAKSDIIISWIIRMKICCFQPDIYHNKRYIPVDRGELSKSISEFFITT